MAPNVSNGLNSLLDKNIFSNELSFSNWYISCNFICYDFSSIVLRERILGDTCYLFFADVCLFPTKACCSNYSFYSMFGKKLDFSFEGDTFLEIKGVDIVFLVKII